MANSKKSKKAAQPLAKLSNRHKPSTQSFVSKALKVLFIVILGIVLAMGIMARLYHYNKYEINKKK